jgi:hypothetical protein
MSYRRAAHPARYRAVVGLVAGAVTAVLVSGVVPGNAALLEVDGGVVEVHHPADGCIDRPRPPQAEGLGPPCDRPPVSPPRPGDAPPVPPGPPVEP